MLFVGRESRGGARVLPGGVSLPYRSIGVLEKKFRNFWKIRNLSGTDAARAVGDVLCDATKSGRIRSIFRSAILMISAQIAPILKDRLFQHHQYMSPRMTGQVITEIPPDG